MAQADIVNAMIATLQGYLAGALPTAIAADGNPIGVLSVTIRAGWPGPDEDLAYPTLAISAPEKGQRSTHAPMQLVLPAPVFPVTMPGDAPGTGTGITSFYSVGVFLTRLQLDIFALSQSDRLRVSNAVEISLAGDWTIGSGILRLNAATYYGLMQGYQLLGPAQQNDVAMRVSKNEWRATFSVQAEGDEVLSVTEKRFTEIDDSFVITENPTLQVPATQTNKYGQTPY